MNQLTERGQPCPHESNPRNSRTRLSALLSVAGSWSLCAVGKTWELSMNLKVVCLQSNDLRKPGSWPQLTSEFWRCSLSMNPDEHPTSNIQRPTSNGRANPRSLRGSLFDVECSMFSLGSGVSTREFS